MPRWLNLPNSLTLLRVILVAPIIAMVLDGRHVTALALFAAASVTDILDGLAARHSGAITQAGAYLDPVADKALLSGVYIALALSRTAPWWFVGLVFARDIYILAGASLIFALTGERKFPPTRWGKLSTFAQIVAAVLLMGRNAFPSVWLQALAEAAIWPAAAATLWSGLHYTRRAWRAFRAH